MSKKLTPQEIADKQVRRAVGAVADYKAGVLATTVSPTAEAAKAVDLWKQGIEEAYANGAYVDGCNACTLADWQNATAGKGAMNYSSGVTASKSLIEDFHTQNQSNQASIDAILRGMPRGDLSQNLQRMITQVQEKANFKFRKRRRS